MKIITNEKKIIDKLISNNTYNIEEYKLILILIKYNYIKLLEKSNKPYDKLIAREKIIEILSKVDNDFQRVKWEDYIDKSIKRFIKGIKLYNKDTKNNIKLIEINSIPIYQKELDIINKYEDKKDKQLLFVLLVYAKVNNIVLNREDGWINQDLSNLFKEAKIRVGNTKYRLDTIRKFMNDELIGVSCRAGKTSIKINYIDNSKDKDKEIAFNVTDFDYIIYDYLIYLGEKYKKCEVCGGYFKVKANAQIRCNKCALEKQKELNRENMKKSRKMKNV